MARILVIDDDKELCALIKNCLEKEGFDVFVLSMPEMGMELFRQCAPDLVVLDILMPGEDSLLICQRIRQQLHAPILLVSAKGGEADKVLGLGLGAADYLVKPFRMHELVAHVNALLRRSRYTAMLATEADNAIFQKGNFMVDPKAYRIWQGGVPLSLTGKEYQLLLYFLQHINQVIGREVLYKEIWEYDSAGDNRTLMVHIRKLRQKIEEEPDRPRYVQTVWGIGYKFVMEK